MDIIRNILFVLLLCAAAGFGFWLMHRVDRFVARGGVGSDKENPNPAVRR